MGYAVDQFHTLDLALFLAGAFAAVTGGLYRSRANTVGGYSAMLAGAAGSVAFFFFQWPVNYAGLGSFVLAAVAMVVGSLISKPGPAFTSAPR